MPVTLPTEKTSMRKLSTLLILALSGAASAQSFVELACGANYAQQAYYRFDDDQTVKLGNGSWDILLTAVGFQDAGIFLNESSSSSFTDPQPELELWLAPTNDFNDPIDPSALTQRRYNDEKGWLYGALNADRNPSNPFDYGWGAYNPATNRVTGNRLFVLKLRDGSYRKLSIDSLVVSTYHLRWAKLDGSDVQTLAIDKKQHSAAGFAFVSLAEGKVLSTAPQGWDLFWGRYTTPLDDGQGGILEYNVTGVLSGPGIAVAEADSVDPLEVDFYAGGYDKLLSNDPTVIGSDWKTYDFAQGWMVDTDRVFFVRTRDQHVWRMVIVDFEGISTGNMVFEKYDLGMLASLDPGTPTAGPASAGPNPALPGQELFLEWPGEAAAATVRLFDLNGSPLWQRDITLNPGFQVLGTLPADLPAGTYLLQVQRGADRWSRPWVILR